MKLDWAETSKGELVAKVGELTSTAGILAFVGKDTNTMWYATVLYPPAPYRKEVKLSYFTDKEQAKKAAEKEVGEACNAD